MHAPTAPDIPAIRLRVAEFLQHAKQAGLESNGDIASRLGVNQSTVWRLLNGETGPGENFIAAVLTRIPDAGFYDLFEVVDPAATGSAA